ncbi:hypothetical protein DFH08DRAFT_979518 [Mycena albidolilacea]|uniref:CxC2-like cysteine cluster KDZ transposase-associated domain-containing protein n=1 Tax=Mycena albidolilacea TaxID=1033008 RepID=A0AAD6YWH7_9AGAR|nr:hypothetical protein DFH08DRAFT_979518 [Mycena albidolilacea]
MHCGRELPLWDGCLFFSANVMNRNKGCQGGTRAPAAPAIASTHAHVVRSQLAVLEYVQEDSFTNAAVESWEFSYDLGDTALIREVQPADDDGIRLTAKKTVYENSDYPMLTWTKHQDEYLDEVLRLEGRSYSAIWLFCKQCIVKRHTVLPTYWVQEWNRTFFERQALENLGLVVQLGHLTGYSCNNPWKAHQDFVVIDVTGVHNVNVNYCLCDSKIERWQQLMQVSVHDFLPSLELLSNNNGLNPVFDRRRAFCHIVRPYQTISMMKCAGHGHDPAGVVGAAQSELALLCRSCPHPGRNLPEGWDNINWDAMPEDLRYKYFLFLAQDCNFRLINRNISFVAKDPIVSDGYEYFVNNAKYTEWIRTHITEKEISTCSGFQAMFLANRKWVKRLRMTGVGGVTCTRHNMWRPNGIGDSQLGEWYATIAYTFNQC